MSAHQKTPLRPLTDSEEACLRRVVRASSERHDRIQRAQALLAVAAGASFSTAARQAQYRTGDSVSQLVARFNQHGLAALDIAEGRGRQPTYGPAERKQMVQRLHQPPERKRDGTASWSLKLLQRSLRATTLPQVCANTIRTALLEAGYSYQRTRTWCLTGTALRKREVRDGGSRGSRTGAKKTLIERAYREAEGAGIVLW
jgi:transposase